MLALRRAERRLSWDANVVRSRMRIWGQGTISIVPTFVPTQQTGRLFLVGLLPWAQEAPSSNLGAPTKISSVI